MQLLKMASNTIIACDYVAEYAFRAGDAPEYAFMQALASEVAAIDGRTVRLSGVGGWRFEMRRNRSWERDFNGLLVFPTVAEFIELMPAD